MIVAVVRADGALLEAGSAVPVPWWSFSKLLIAAAALRLSEQELVALDERLEGLPYTLRQLLQHRAGVEDYGGDRAYHEAVARGDMPWSEAELLRRHPADRLGFEPGSAFAYSNVGYLIVRRVIERAAGAGLAAVLERAVLGPLGLRDSRLAVGRDDMAATAFAGGQDYDPGWVFHGCVIGPAAEAALGLHRLMTGGVLGAGELAAMVDWQPVPGHPFPGRPWVSGGYGLGSMVGAMGEIEVVGHSAGGPGSVGAVYRGAGRTVAAFVEGADEGVAEFAVLARLQAELGGCQPAADG